MKTRLILVRHGETPASREGRFAGSTDVELTDLGREQASALAGRLRHLRIDALYASPLMRCKQTAAAISETTGLKVREADELRECHFGGWENMTASELQALEPDVFTTWLSDDTYAPPDGESWGSVAERTWTWWQAASAKHEGRTVLAVSHGGAIRSLLRRAVDASLRTVFSMVIDPCSVSMLESRAGFWRVSLLNDTSHLHEPLKERPSEARRDGATGDLAGRRSDTS